jgi:hypothetical protein
VAGAYCPIEQTWAVVLDIALSIPRVPKRMLNSSMR